MNLKKLFLLVLIPSSLTCVDLPNFYRAQFFQGETKYDTSDWTTHFDARYAEGSTKNSWNTQEVKTELFNAYGPFKLKNLADNIENITLASKPNTYAFINGTNTYPINNLFDGTIKLKGNFKTEEFDFTLQQNLFSGIYLQAYVPIRRIGINGIDYVQSVTTDSEHATIMNFLNSDLDGILSEFDIVHTKTAFSRTEVSDILLSIGWNGHVAFKESMMTALRGFIQAGVVVPVARKKDLNHIASISTGYNRHFAFNVRGNAHATLWEKVVVGANVGAQIFMTQTYLDRVTTSTHQNGWIVLEKAKVQRDPGTMWDIGAYAKLERILGGLSITGGYSFVQQEKTTLTLKDDSLLQTALTNEAIFNKNEVINHNKLFSQWYQHVLHGVVGYDFGAHVDRFAPRFEVFYDYPVLGKHAWPTDMYGGTIGFTFNWNF